MCIKPEADCNIVKDQFTKTEYQKCENHTVALYEMLDKFRYDYQMALLKGCSNHLIYSSFLSAKAILAKLYKDLHQKWVS